MVLRRVVAQTDTADIGGRTVLAEVEAEGRLANDSRRSGEAVIPGVLGREADDLGGTAVPGIFGGGAICLAILAILARGAVVLDELVVGGEGFLEAVFEIGGLVEAGGLGFETLQGDGEDVRRVGKIEQGRFAELFRRLVDEVHGNVVFAVFVLPAGEDDLAADRRLVLDGIWQVVLLNAERGEDAAYI